MAKNYTGYCVCIEDGNHVLAEFHNGVLIKEHAEIYMKNHRFASMMYNICKSSNEAIANMHSEFPFIRELCKCRLKTKSEMRVVGAKIEAGVVLSGKKLAEFYDYRKHDANTISYRRGKEFG